jgi:hypothetical protein
LTNFHGVFASHAKERTDLLPKAAVAKAKEKSAAQSWPSPRIPAQGKRPRLDWATLQARTWGGRHMEVPVRRKAEGAGRGDEPAHR